MRCREKGKLSKNKRVQWIIGDVIQTSLCRASTCAQADLALEVPLAVQECSKAVNDQVAVPFLAQAEAYHAQVLASDPSLAKYYAQRYQLFANFDSGILLDAESWFSVTPEAIARHQALQILRLIVKQHGITLPDDDAALSEKNSLVMKAFLQESRVKQVLADVVVIDGFCGAGGNAIQFAKLFPNVIAIDKDPVKVYLARNNFRVHGLSCVDRDERSSLQSDVSALDPNVLFINDDYFEAIKCLDGIISGTTSVANGATTEALESFLRPLLHRHHGQLHFYLFLSPPWGGPSYLNRASYNINSMMDGIGIRNILKPSFSFCQNFCLFLPRNTAAKHLKKLAAFLPSRLDSDGNVLSRVVNVEENYMNDKCKAITVYYT